jgi:hypothetical protein
MAIIGWGGVPQKSARASLYESRKSLMASGSFGFSNPNMTARKQRTIY